MENNVKLPAFRVGCGYDVHKLVPERKLILCGVQVPYELGLLGHSDADVALHALMDALLGAAALGDIGKHFPDTDPKYKGANSLVLLEEVYKMMVDRGYYINNLDALIMIERPKMAPHIDMMRNNIAKCLHTDVNNVSIKATRGEKMGFVGREEGVLCQCVVLIDNK